MRQVSEETPKSTKTGTTTLKPKEVDIVVDICNTRQLLPFEIEPYLVENTGITWNKLSLPGSGNPITWHCENTDFGKKKEGHNVCWISGSAEFQGHQSLQDFELFNFGKIQTLISLPIEGKELYFARVERFQTLDYELGDIWMCERTDGKEIHFLPLSLLSPPVITAKCGNKKVAVLNSHVRFMPIHARLLLDHIKPQ